MLSRNQPPGFNVVFLISIACTSVVHADDGGTRAAIISQPEKKTRRVYWDDGLQFVSASGLFRVKLGGQAQIDTAAFAGVDDTEQFENGIEWRRARLYTTGEIGTRWSFKFQWDFADAVRLKDAFLRFSMKPFGQSIQLQGGRFTSTFGLENDGSSNDTLFMEQGLTAVLLPPQETGVLVHSESPDRRWDLGFTSGARAGGCLLCDVSGVTGRYSMGFALGTERRILHVGGDFSRRWTDNEASFAERPESHIAPRVVDTGSFSAERVDVGLIEAALLSGAFSLQTEIGAIRIKRPDTMSTTFYAFYVFGSYALTGEMRRYRENLGTIRRIQPSRPLRSGGGGLGAFELAFRFSRVDLNDQDIQGGALNDVTLGLNWYPTRATRIAVNVIRGNRQDWDPFWIFQFRLQLAY